MMQTVYSMNDPWYLLGFALFVSAVQSFPRVTTFVGSIEGYYKVSHHGRPYEAYEGIPYALPPIGHLRFEPPRNYTDLSDTDNVLIAKRLGHVCTQYDEKLDRVRGSEDCLYLNIYCPLVLWIPTDDLLPVIFYIHGDDFQTGSGGEHGPKYLLDRDVVVVTFNYRLGPLGFLSTEDNEVPGNMGLKDQVVALRWVRRNIKHFGGDYTNIAIVGHGAGGASVHYHYMTKQTWGLFNKGMSLSGTALAPWAQAKGSLEKARKLAAIVECPTETIPAMVKCLKQQPADHLVRAIGQFKGWLTTPIAPFGPVVEKSKQKFTFIDESPTSIITSGKALDVPWMTGIVGDEGLAVGAAFLANQSSLDYMTEHWESISPYLLDFNYTVPQSMQSRTATVIKSHYLGTNPFSWLSMTETLNMIGHRLFVTNAAQAASLQASAGIGPIRFYKFTYRGAHSFTELHTRTDFGVTHKDDLAYVFELPVDTSTTADDQVMRKKMLDLWISYAKDKYGQPKVGVDWTYLKENSKEINYLHIVGPNLVEMDTVTDLGDQDFWASLSIDENSVNWNRRFNAHPAKVNHTEQESDLVSKLVQKVE